MEPSRRTGAAVEAFASRRKRLVQLIAVAVALVRPVIVRAKRRDTRTITYVFTNALVLVIGICLTLLTHHAAQGVGESILAAGVVGVLFFLYESLEEEEARQRRLI